MAQRGRPPKYRPGTPTAPPDVSLLTAEEKNDLRQRAIEQVDEEERERAQDAYLETALLEVRRSRQIAEPEEEQREILIDLAGHSRDIRLDGIVFIHGRVYTVGKRVYDVLAEIMARGWNHERSVGGANDSEYRKPHENIVRLAA